LLFVSFTPDAKWELVNQEENILVYTRFCKLNNVNEVMVTTTIQSSLSNLVYIIQNVKEYPEWVYLCRKSKTIHKISNTEQVYYMETDAPWPVTNRSAVIHGKTIQDSMTREVTILSTLVKNSIAADNNCIPVKRVNAIWKLMPLDKNTVKVSYYLDIDPGGNIPDWFKSYSLHYGPYKTMIALHHKAEINYSKEAAYSYIEDFD